MNPRLPSSGRSAWFRSGSVPLGDRWVPCPATSSISAPGPYHLPELIPRQAALLSPLPRGGTDGLLAARSSTPANHFPSHSSAKAGAGVTFRGRGGGPGTATRRVCRKEHWHSPFPPRRAWGKRCCCLRHPYLSGGVGAPVPPPGRRCTHLGRRPEGGVAAIAPLRPAERAGSPPGPASLWAGSGSQARAHWPASQ